MSETEAIVMEADDRDAFLGTGGTGVISFGRSGEDPPHALPVSYGYDRSETSFYFRLAVGPESDKDDLAGQSVTFVVYGQDDERWRSVIAKGSLEPTTDGAVATESLEGLQQVHIPLVDIFGRPARDVPFEFYRLDPDELTAREETSTAE